VIVVGPVIVWGEPTLLDKRNCLPVVLLVTVLVKVKLVEAPLFTHFEKGKSPYALATLSTVTTVPVAEASSPVAE
jgi:hypothetical protein